MAQTTTTQLGSNAVAHPTGMTGFPPATPHLHHLDNKGEIQSDNTVIDDDLTFHDLPPFPDDVPTAPLLRLSLRRLIEEDPKEIENLWRACCDLGFFYLDLRGGVSASESKRDSFREEELADKSTSRPKGENEIDSNALLSDAEALFHLGDQLFDLPVEEKVKYDFKDKGSYFGYKGYGTGVVDAKGTKDRNEFYNVSKDDLLGISEPLAAPQILQDETNRALLKSYMQRSHAIISLLLGQLNARLGLPPATLTSLHRLQGVSGDQVRWVRAPPQPENDRSLSLGEHTDFGSMTVLFNQLGGLQVLPPGGQWCYVKPLKGHCVVNLGDAMVKFSAGILRSNIHRVVNPPGEQGGETRMSLVYFGRPEDEVILKTLEGSEMIDERRKQHVEFAGEELITAKEWILRRAMGRRTGGDWAKSGGTEGDRVNS